LSSSNSSVWIHFVLTDKKEFSDLSAV